MTATGAAAGAIRIIFAGIAHGADARIADALRQDASGRKVDLKRASHGNVTGIRNAGCAKAIFELLDDLGADLEAFGMNMRTNVNVAS